MSFTLPVFNITCEVFTGPWLTKVLRISGQECNLAMGRRVQQLPADISPDHLAVTAMTLLVPPLTDVRDSSCSNTPDVVEVPSGSGRWYTALCVDDLGKGFANEHRLVVLGKLYETLDPGNLPGLFWPTPIP